MLDFRHETFLALCRIGNYTKAAEHLHITQPAVSQHIKFLEEQYGGKLFSYDHKTLKLTQRGKKLQDFALTVSADSKRLSHMLINDSVSTLCFGATLSIGEFILPEIVSKMIEKNPTIQITMPVDNTQVLLKKLRASEIDFAFIEGYFDKTEYDSVMFSKEEFITVCSPAHALANKKATFEDIFNERLILRELGSGTRNVFEQILHQFNLNVSSFQNICEIGNMSAIKQLVARNNGITFLYRVAAKAELERGVLSEIHLEKFPVVREFSFVYLKNSLHKKEYLSWLEFSKNI